MFSSLLCQCCSSEPAEAPQLLFSNNEEHITLPVLLDPKSQVLTKGKPEAMLSGADVMKTKSAPLSDGPPLLLEEPELSVQSPTATQETVKKPNDAQPENSAEQLPRELPEPEAEAEETIHEDAHHSDLSASEHDHAPPENQRERAPQTGRESVSSKTPDEIVAEFTKKAVGGVHCVHFNETTGKRIMATYKLSSDLTQFTIEADKRGVFSRFSVNFPVTRVHDVDDYDGTSNLLKPKAAATLTNRETEAFLMIFYEGEKGDMASVCLLESSVEKRARFAIALKALASSRILRGRSELQQKELANAQAAPP
jgi:hypothetical protein